jgi:hypothetical protein
MKTHYSELLKAFLINEGYQYHENNEKSNFTLDIREQMVVGKTILV